jgi:hypothetical protein
LCFGIHPRSTKSSHSRINSKELLGEVAGHRNYPSLTSLDGVKADKARVFADYLFFSAVSSDLKRAASVEIIIPSRGDQYEAQNAKL